MSSLHLSLRVAFFLCFSCTILAENSHSERNEVTTGRNVVGQWVSEPLLGQLGWTQSRISFQEGGAYSQKLDMISFCDGRDRGIDCEHFWMITEGDYFIDENVITINIKNDKKVVLLTGQAEPEITENFEYPRTQKILVERQGDNLLIRKSPDDEATVFLRED